jgi:hypothetical protein
MDKPKDPENPEEEAEEQTEVPKPEEYDAPTNETTSIPGLPSGMTTEDLMKQVQMMQGGNLSKEMQEAAKLI